jgi:hypothetical protein
MPKEREDRVVTLVQPYNMMSCIVVSHLVTASVVATIAVAWTRVMSYRKSCGLVRSAPVYAFEYDA